MNLSQYIEMVEVDLQDLGTVQEVTGEIHF
jgi:hypothetical protein